MKYVLNCNFFCDKAGHYVSLIRNSVIYFSRTASNIMGTASRQNDATSALWRSGGCTTRPINWKLYIKLLRFLYTEKQTWLMMFIFNNSERIWIRIPVICVIFKKNYQSHSIHNTISRKSRWARPLFLETKKHLIPSQIRDSGVLIFTWRQRKSLVFYLKKIWYK